MAACALQFPGYNGGHCNTPMQWSPDSRLLSFYDGVLHVLNCKLEHVCCWPDQSPAFASEKHVAACAWTPSCHLLGVVPTSGQVQPQSYRAEGCWDGFQAGAESSAEAEGLKVLLAHLGAQETVVHLACSPLTGVALVTSCGPRYDGQYKLYIMLAGSLPASLALSFSRYAWEAEVIWSPAGDRLLVNCPEQLQLVTTACVLLVDIRAGCCDPTFSPDGRHVAAVFKTTLQQKVHMSCRLFRASDGEIIFDHSWLGGVAVDRLAFNTEGDQLLITGRNKIHVVSFGQAYEAEHMSSRQLCEALAGACSWVNTLVVPDGEDEEV